MVVDTDLIPSEVNDFSRSKTTVLKPSFRGLKRDMNFSSPPPPPPIFFRRWWIALKVVTSDAKTGCIFVGSELFPPPHRLLKSITKDNIYKKKKIEQTVDFKFFRGFVHPRGDASIHLILSPIHKHVYSKKKGHGDSVGGWKKNWKIT